MAVAAGLAGATVMMAGYGLAAQRSPASPGMVYDPMNLGVPGQRSR